MSDLLQTLLAVLSVVATALLAIVASILSGLRTDIKKHGEELAAHKADTIAHRTKQEEELWIRTDSEFRTEIRDRLKRIESKLDR